MADYTRLAHKDIQEILSQYDLCEPYEVTSMAGGQANTSYRIACGTQKYILSVCDEKNPNEVDILIQVLLYLEENRFPTSRPVLTKSSAPFVIHENKPVYIKEYMDGQVVEHLSAGMVYEAGKMMAQLHQIPPPDCIPKKFPYGKEAFHSVVDSGMEHPYIPWLKQKSDYIRSHLAEDTEKGFIHGDIYWDNLLFEDGCFRALLDFEEASEYYLLYDIAMTCVGCCSKNGRFDKKKISALIDGYQSIQKISSIEKKHFPVFALYAAVAGSFWRFRQYNIKLKGHEKADSYKELVSLAEHALELNWNHLFNG